MKQKVFFALVFVFALSLSICSAETTVSETSIVFRDIEWCASINAVMDSLSPYINFKGTVLSEKDVPPYSVAGTHVEKSGFVYNQSDFKENFFVAGHLVSDVDVYAAYGVVNGVIVKDIESSRIYRCTYTFPCKSKEDEAFDDLEAKLASIYGMPVLQSSTSTLQEAGWEDAEGNVVLIRKSSNSQNLYITYYYGGTLDIIDELQSLQYTNDLSSVDGL